MNNKKFLLDKLEKIYKEEEEIPVQAYENTKLLISTCDNNSLKHFELRSFLPPRLTLMHGLHLSLSHSIKIAGIFITNNDYKWGACKMNRKGDEVSIGNYTSYPFDIFKCLQAIDSIKEFHNLE